MREYRTMAAGNMLMLEDRKLTDNSTVYDISAVSSEGYHTRLYDCVSERDAMECWHQLTRAYERHCV